MEWPNWWEWELEFIDHLRDRMVDRTFNEIELRQMLDDARGFRPSHTEGRYVIETVIEDADWEVVVDPDYEDERLVVITAYRCD